MQIKPYIRFPRGRQSAFTIMEVVVSMIIIAVTIAGIVTGYVYSSRQAEFSAYFLAGHSLALQRIEQMRASKWDVLTTPIIDELVIGNFPDQTNVLDLPQTGGNGVFALSRAFITELSANPPLRMLRVECSWTFMERGSFTNTLVTYRSPDQ